MKKTIKFIGKTILRFATIIGMVVLCLSVIGVFSFYNMMSGEDDEMILPDQFVITYDLGGAMPTMPERKSYLDQFFGSQTSLYDFLRVLEKAKTDNRVTGFVVTLQDGNYSLTQLQAMRNAVIDFRHSGKKTAIYTDSFGDFSNGTAEYWFASAFESIHIQPVGNLSLNGIYIEQPYVRDVLDKVGVEPQMIQRKAYKTGPETYTRNDMSAESKETLEAIGEAMMGTIIGDIAQSRNLNKSQVVAAMQNAPLTTLEAMNGQFIDGFSYYDVFEDTFAPDDKVKLARYLGDLDAKKGIPLIAYIPIEGMILKENPSIKLTAPMAMILPDDIAEANEISMQIMDAADNKDIKVVLLGINSPGGSPTASETIRRAVVYAREKGKFVIAAMGDVAASGGYWIAVDANQIIASNLTITGSIGVYGGKMNLKGLWDKIGVNWDSVQMGNNAGIWSMNKPYSASERAQIEKMMDEVYIDFTQRVAEGRNLSKTMVEMAAQGRAWMGHHARLKGLVDLNGAFDFALKRAAAEAGGEGWSDVTYLNMQADPDPIDELMKLMGVTVQSGIQIPKALLSAMVPEAVVTAPVLEMEF